MSATALVDPIVAIEAAGEGWFEFAEGRLIELPPQSHDHARRFTFLIALLQHFVEERGLGAVVVPDGFAGARISWSTRPPESRSTGSWTRSAGRPVLAAHQGRLPPCPARR